MRLDHRADLRLGPGDLPQPRPDRLQRAAGGPRGLRGRDAGAAPRHGGAAEGAGGADADGLSCDVHDGVVEVEVDEARLSDFLAGLAADGVRYREISMRRPTLEDYFLKLAADAARARANPPTTDRDDARGGPAMRASLGRIVAMMLRHLYLMPRTLENWGETLYWPVVNLILWGLTTRWLESSSGSVPRLALIVLTGVVFWQIVWRANYEISVNLLEEFWNQNMANLFATPLERLGVVGQPGRARADQEPLDGRGRDRGASGCSTALA